MWTVDYQEDFDFLEQIFKALGNDFKMQDVLELMKKNPELITLNVKHNSRDKAYHVRCFNLWV